jgi:DnaJ-class molecular chaperone
MNTTDRKHGSETAPADMNPGDQAPAGSPQAGENTCPECAGAGKLGSGAACENCGGTGKVIELVGDA